MSKIKKGKTITVLFAVLMLTGCGIVAIGYNYAGVYLRYSINSYASFNDQQKETIKRDVNNYMSWHRMTMLPDYVLFLKELQTLVQTHAEINNNDVAHSRLQARSLYINTLRPTIIPATTLLRSVDNGQIQEMILALAKDNKKLKEKELGDTLEEGLDKRSERTINFIENFVDGLNDKQLDIVRLLSHKLPYTSALNIKLRENNQDRLIELLKNHAGEEEIAAFLTNWLERPEESRSSEEQKLISAFESAADVMVVEIYHLLTDRQKHSLDKNIVKYIDTFQDLASKN